MFNKLVNILAILSFAGLVLFSFLPENDFTLTVAVACCWVLVATIFLLFFRLLKYINADTYEEEADSEQTIDAVIRTLRRIHNR